MHLVLDYTLIKLYDLIAGMQLQPLLSAVNATNVTIEGGNGTIDGNGWYAWWLQGGEYWDTATDAPADTDAPAAGSAAATAAPAAAAYAAAHGTAAEGVAADAASDVAASDAASDAQDEISMETRILPQ